MGEEELYKKEKQKEHQDVQKEKEAKEYLALAEVG